MSIQPPGEDNGNVTIAGQTISESSESHDVSQARGSATTFSPSQNRFRIKRRLGEGGHGIVWIADDLELKREVAIKELRFSSRSEEEVERFEVEARITGFLDHPGVPPVYAMGVFEDGRRFYAMRLIEGKTLKQAINDFHEKFPSSVVSLERTRELRRLLGSLVNVCQTIRFAHSRQVLHRDLKPSNIMLGEYGETLVLDWGLAKFGELSVPYSTLNAMARRRSPQLSDATESSGFKGTPHFMSPEQAKGEWDDVNSRSDVYSLGATLYQLLTGKLPFGGKSPEEVIENVKRGVQLRPRQRDARIPPELDVVCMKAMSLKREDRYASPGEMANEIERWLSDEPLESYREPYAKRMRRWLVTHQAAVAAIVAVLACAALAIAIGAVLLTLQKQELDKATKLADRTLQEAAQTKKDARNQVVRILAVANNESLSHFPGSESARIVLLNSVIEQLEQWCLENPSDTASQTDLIGALRRRSRLYDLTHNPVQARHDLEYALRAISKLFESNNPELLSQLQLTRLFSMREMGSLLDTAYGPSVALAYLEPARELASVFFYKRPNERGRRLAFAVINFQIAKELKGLGRLAEAMDCLDRSASELDSLSSESFEEFKTWVQNTPELLARFANETHLLQGEIAYLSSDHEFASACSQAVHQSCSRALAEGFSSIDLLTIKVRAIVLDAKIAIYRESPHRALDVLRHSARIAVSLAKRVPGNNSIHLLVAELENSHAEHELLFGSLTQAECAIGFALDELMRMNAEVGPQEGLWIPWSLARAHRLQAETAIAEGDSEKARTHIFAARACLFNLPPESPHADELIVESMRLESVTRTCPLIE